MRSHECNGETHTASDEIPSVRQEVSERPLVLAASTGGHLAQLVRFAPLLGATDDSLWITFDSPQSRSLLAGKNVLLVPYIAPRDYHGILRAFRLIRSRLHKSSRTYDEAISTGAAIALAALPAAKVSGIPTRYIESVSRTAGPSLTGKVLEHLRFCVMETQYEHWAGPRWQYRRSVMKAFEAHRHPAHRADLKIFVTLGTIKPYRFDSAVDAILRTGLANEATVWQLGCTARGDLPGVTHNTIEDSEFDRNILEADVVITHAGVGSILRILELGKFPVVLPRRKSRGEHVDDHQLQIAQLIHENKLGIVTDLDALTARDVEESARWRVAQKSA